MRLAMLLALASVFGSSLVTIRDGHSDRAMVTVASNGPVSTPTPQPPFPNPPPPPRRGA